MHAFLVVDCRTPDCKTLHALKYLGEQGKIPAETAVSMPAPLWLRCPNCELNHDYTLSQVRQILQDEPPPSDFRDTI
jgi:hypothetical protein